MADNGSWWSKDTVAVVTGADRGIGFEIVKQLADKGVTAVLTAQDEALGRAACDALHTAGFQSVVFHQLDILFTESVEELAEWLTEKFGGFDILVNNAGVCDANYSYEVAKHIVDTNYGGTKRITERLLPLLRASPAGARIVNIASRVGLYERLGAESLKQKFRDDDYSTEWVASIASKYLEDMKEGRAFEEGWLQPEKLYHMYSESKIFLSAYSVALSKHLAKSQPEQHQIFVACACPGPTSTDMYRASIEQGVVVPADGSIPPAHSPAEGADTPSWLALLPRDELMEKNGKFFGERTEYPFGMQMPF